MQPTRLLSVALLATAAPGQAQPARIGPATALQRQIGIGIEAAPLLFEEKWTRAPQAQPITQANLGNPKLQLHLYGDVAGIRKTFHPAEDYTYTGETLSNWGITVSDPQGPWDLSGNGKVRLTTRNSGYRFTHVMLKTADGAWFVSEEGSPESTSWIDRDYVLADLHWRSLMMTDTPTNASNVRKPLASRQPIIPLGVAVPNLASVQEIGFTDLMPGGWIPSTSRVKSWAVYGKHSTAAK